MPNFHKSKVFLYYVHDPMCSWCWGYKPVLQELSKKLPDLITLQYVLGGLAIDTDKTMSIEMQNRIQSTWKEIQKQIPGTKFNYDFWTHCKPRRSTYASCRAVIAAGNQGENKAYEMLDAIQHAYYLNAQNPSDKDTLIELSKQINLNTEQFSFDLDSEDTEKQLNKQIEFSRTIGADSFPSLYLRVNDQYYPVAIDYNDCCLTLEHINSLITS